MIYDTWILIIHPKIETYSERIRPVKNIFGPERGSVPRTRSDLVGIPAPQPLDGGGTVPEGFPRRRRGRLPRPMPLEVISDMQARKGLR